MHVFGLSDKNKCTWSLDTCPLIISTDSFWQISLIISRTFNAISPVSIFFRYFVIHTRCKWIKKTLWLPWTYSAIWGSFSSRGAGSHGYYLRWPGVRQEEMLKLPAKAGGFNPPKP
jgi:hypothetical protein